MLSLQVGDKPTYRSCAANTAFSRQANNIPGTVFCLTEAGKMVGVTVTSAQPSYAVLQITVWQNVS